MPSKSVTVMVDNTIIESQKGQIHVWLILVTENCSQKWFSFSNPDILSVIGIPNVGISSVDDHLKERMPSSYITFLLKRFELRRIEKAIDHFYDSEPDYLAVPVSSDQYNCVTAASEILDAGGLEYFDECIMPGGVEKIIENTNWNFVDEQIVSYHKRVKSVASDDFYSTRNQTKILSAGRYPYYTNQKPIIQKPNYYTG